LFLFYPAEVLVQGWTSKWKLKTVTSHWLLLSITNFCWSEYY